MSLSDGLGLVASLKVVGAGVTVFDAVAEHEEGRRDPTAGEPENRPIGGDAP
jgi:hypothetical protein